MEQASKHQDILLEEAREHYRRSRYIYDIEGGEGHLAYYREKHPFYYSVLLQAV